MAGRCWPWSPHHRGNQPTGAEGTDLAGSRGCSDSGCCDPGVSLISWACVELPPRREPDQRSSWWWHELDHLSADAFLGHGCLLWACTFAPHSGRRDWSAGSVALALSPAGGSSVSLRAGCFRAANTARSTATVSCVLCHRQRMDRWASLPLAQGCHLPRLMQMSPGELRLMARAEHPASFSNMTCHIGPGRDHGLQLAPQQSLQRPQLQVSPSTVGPGYIWAR